MSVKFNPFTGNFTIAGGGGAPASIGDSYVRTTRFAIISSGSSGTVTLPANSTVVLDDFGGTTDAVVAQVSGGKPLLSPAKTSSGTIIATTFDSSGNWSLSDTPSSYPIAILYRIRQKLVDFDSTASDIWGNSTVEQDSVIDIQTFTSSGTWTKPTDAKLVEVWLLGAGGGGGSGRIDNAGTVRCGGGGGGSGALVNMRFNATVLGATETITIGAGGAGGTRGVSTTIGNGASGSAGGNTTFGSWIKALGGFGGGGGTASTGTGGTAAITIPGPNFYAQFTGANASTTGGNASTTTTSSFQPTAGGAGGGITSVDVVGNASAGGTISSFVSDILSLAGGTAAGAAPANGGDGNNATFIFGMQIGSGGGGSRGGTTGTGNGGNGGKGAGGGGAGATVTGNISGSGGNGGDGWVVVITYF